MKDLQDTVLVIFLVALLTAVQVSGALLPRMYALTDSVMALRLVRGCEVWRFEPPAQAMSTFVLACPRMDLIRLWPLQVQQPWWEDSEP